MNTQTKWMLAAACGAGVLAVLNRKTLEAAYENGAELGRIVLDYVQGFPVEREMAKSLRAMIDAAANDGVALVVDSAFRTMAEQTKLYAEHVAGTRNDPVARPGYSKHQNGRAVDIQVHRSTSSDEYRWLAANAAAYGFSNVGAHFSSPEFWHWEWSA